MKIAKTRWSIVAGAICTLSLLIISGCLAPYDQTSDQKISAIYQQFDAHVDAVSKPAATQPTDQTFYNNLRSELRALRLRTEARGADPSLKSQAALIDELLKQVDAAEKLEQSGLHGEAWQTVEDGLSTNFKGFLTAELARKKSE